ncbi:uncharacterized protein LOC135168007 [Diachasmimorpha longicaudata]|uniref:uncharacterized protein LOC135168007 n=1 Tax=Diachasmimorpha longicaudata TaxID=58733 RepID=UPI0030B90EF0
MANLVRNIFKYSRDYLRSSYRLVHNDVNKDKVETQIQKDDDDFSRRNYTKPTDTQSPRIVNFFEDSPSTKTTSSDTWTYRSQELPKPDLPSKNYLVRELRQDTQNLRTGINENRSREQSNANLTNLLIEIKSALEEIKRREVQTNTVANIPSTYLGHLRMMIVKNEREDREKRRLNILIIGLSVLEEDVTSRVSELLEKHLNLYDCVASARVMGKNNNVVLVQLKSAEAKAEIQKNQAVLKPMGIKIRPDLTAGQRFLHRRLREIGLEAMKLGKSVKFGYMWIRIDDVKYYWNYRTDSLQPQRSGNEWNS